MFMGHIDLMSYCYCIHRVFMYVCICRHRIDLKVRSVLCDGMNYTLCVCVCVI